MILHEISISKEKIVKECLGYFLIYVAIAVGVIFLSGYELTWREKLGIFLGLTIFLGLVVAGSYLIAG